MSYHICVDESYQVYISDFNTLAIKKVKTPMDEYFELAAAYSGELTLACGGRDKHGYLSGHAHLLPDNGRFQSIRPLPHPRARHAVTTATDGSFIIVGGVTEDQDGSLVLARDILAYDPKSDRWDTIAELPRRAAQLVVEQVDGKLVVIGGDTGTTTEPGRPIAPARCRNDVQILDLTTGKWTLGTPKPVTETGITSAVLGKEIAVVSSYDPQGIVNAFVEVYNVTTDS